MSFIVPVVEAKFTLLPDLSHGRRGLSSGHYRPHIVVGPESQRVAVREGNRFTESYLGVMFVGGPDTMEPGDSAKRQAGSDVFSRIPLRRGSAGSDIHSARRSVDRRLWCHSVTRNGNFSIADGIG